MSTRTIVETGFDGTVAEIECRISQGLPSVVIVGFASKAVDEARERIRSAFDSLPIDWPKKRIVINLAPADIPKEHTSFDLAIAASVLESSRVVPAIDTNTGFYGELGLDGTLRPVRGLIGKLLAARSHGLKTAFIPAANQDQARLVEGLRLYACNSLLEVYQHLSGESPRKKLKPITKAPTRTAANLIGSVRLSDVVGQESAKRALIIAAAGQHNLLLNGPPGTGKSMLGKALVSLLPPMSYTEILETTHLHSLRGNNYGVLVTSRPFRSPHHSASDAAITGGGQRLRPGEISLAHNGVLFFDELPEFKRNIIEALRQPLEEHRISLSRAQGNTTLPARFILVATANPCPCGFFGTSQPCRCPTAKLNSYQRKLSGPILDRIDLYVPVDHIDHKKLLKSGGDPITDKLARKQILQASQRQLQRYGQSRYNSQLDNREVKRFIKLTAAAQNLLNYGAGTLDLSPRAYMRTLKVARTIADLDGVDKVDKLHISEALRYRRVPTTDA